MNFIAMFVRMKVLAHKTSLAPPLVIEVSVTSKESGRHVFVSSTVETDRHDITELLLKGALNTMTLTIYICMCVQSEILRSFDLNLRFYGIVC